MSFTVWPCSLNSHFPEGKITSVHLSRLCLLHFLVPSHLTSTAYFCCLSPYCSGHCLLAIQYPFSTIPPSPSGWVPDGTQTPLGHSLFSKQPGEADPTPSFRDGIDWCKSNPFIPFANRLILANMSEVWGGTSLEWHLFLLKEGHRKKHILFLNVMFGASVAICYQPENEASSVLQNRGDDNIVLFSQLWRPLSIWASRHGT